jgi:hypothetical protein
MNDFMVRGPHPDDVPFIYATWLNSYRYGSHDGKAHHNDDFFDDCAESIDAILTRKEIKILVACDPDNSNVILAYFIFQPNCIHYAFTKHPFRKLGIQTLLFNKAFPDYEDQTKIYYTHKTLSSDDVFRNKLNFRYRHFNLFKGVKDGCDVSRKESAQDAHGNWVRPDRQQNKSSSGQEY